MDSHSVVIATSENRKSTRQSSEQASQPEGSVVMEKDGSPSPCSVTLSGIGCWGIDWDQGVDHARDRSMRGFLFPLPWDEI